LCAPKIAIASIPTSKKMHPRQTNLHHRRGVSRPGPAGANISVQSPPAAPFWHGWWPIWTTIEVLFMATRYYISLVVGQKRSFAIQAHQSAKICHHMGQHHHGAEGVHYW
jgi:hypothetical protein